MAVSSTVLGFAALIISWLLPKTRHWPLFWAVSLMASVATAFLAVSFAKALPLMPHDTVSENVFHGTLGETIWPAMTGALSETLAVSTWPINLSHIIISIYVLGVVMTLLKLAIGRYRAANIARGSTPFDLVDGTIIGLTSEALPCMTVTPFGRPAQSRIIISDDFRRALTEAELSAVIAHERAHIFRRDDELGLVLRCLAALAWFNPVTQALFNRWTLSAEFECDRLATGGYSIKMRRAYAQTLLKALHIAADRVRQYPAASLSTQHLRNEKMRINHIMNGPAPRFKAFRHTFAFMTLAVAATLTGAAGLSGFIDVELGTTSYAAEAPKPNTAPVAKPMAQVSGPTTELGNSFNLAGTLTSAYGPAKDPFKKGATRNHFGVDYKAPLGTPIYAPASGVVTEATDLFNGNANYGKVVVLETDGGVQTMLAHLNDYNVRVGQTVSKGQKIAEVGNTGKSTGPHVHIETRLNGTRVDPMTVWQLSK